MCFHKNFDVGNSVNETCQKNVASSDLLKMKGRIFDSYNERVMRVGMNNKGLHYHTPTEHAITQVQNHVVSGRGTDSDFHVDRSYVAGMHEDFKRGKRAP